VLENLSYDPGCNEAEQAGRIVALAARSLSNDTDEELTKRFREHARDDLAIVDRLSDFFLGLNFNRLLRSARAPRPESPKEKAELQKRVNSLVDKWAVQHAERLKAAKRRRTQSK
jgi:hypothetical protein